MKKYNQCILYVCFIDGVIKFRKDTTGMSEVGLYYLEIGLPWTEWNSNLDTPSNNIGTGEYLVGRNVGMDTHRRRMYLTPEPVHYTKPVTLSRLHDVCLRSFYEHVFRKRRTLRQRNTSSDITGLVLYTRSTVGLSWRSTHLLRHTTVTQDTLNVEYHRYIH